MIKTRENKFQRILVIKLRLIGDVLLSTPVFAALREAFPAAHIAACVSAGTAAILDGDPNVNEVIVGTVAARDQGKVKKELGIARQIRSGRFDLVLDLTTSDRSAILTRLSGAARRIGYKSHKGFWGRSGLYTDTVAAVRNEHMVLKHCRILEPLGIPIKKPKLVFPVSMENRAAVAHLLPAGKTFFQVHPVSRIAKKNWPVPFVAETVNAIVAARGWVPVITGSNDAREKAEIDSLKKLLRGEMIDLSGRVSLKELGAVSERAKFFLGVDTAPMHIAAAVGTPVASFFGPSSEQLWAPWCEKKLILSRTELDCRLPCKNKHGCQTIHCLREFTPATIWPQLESFLRKVQGTT
jgi:heptosyltransferase III